MERIHPRPGLAEELGDLRDRERAITSWSGIQMVWLFKQILFHYAELIDHIS